MRTQQSLSATRLRDLKSRLNAVYASQSTWGIDPVSGDDGNSGVDGVGTRLKTIGELFNRIDNVELVAPTTVTILSDCATTDVPHGARLRVGKLCTSFLMKGTNTTLYTGTATSRTNIARATNVPPDVTDTALAASNSWAAYVAARGTRVRDTTSGASAWPIKDLGTKKARVSNWIVNTPGQATYSTAGVDITATDAIVVERLTKIEHIGIDIHCYEDFSFTPRVNFQDLQFTTRSVFNSDTYPSCDAVCFFGCDVGQANFQGAHAFINCRFGDGVNPFALQASELDIYGGASYGTFNVAGGRVVADFGFIVQGGAGLNVSATAESSYLADVAVFDSSGAGLILGAMGSMQLAAYFGSFALWGSGNTTYGTRVLGGVVVPAVTFTGATITGTTAAVGIGGTGAILSKTWGNMPFVASDITGGTSGTKISGLVIQ